MNEEHFAYKVRQHLNRGLQELSPETLERLTAVRQEALSYQKQTASLSVLATAGSFVQYHYDNLRIKQVLTALALFLCVIFSTYWMAERNVDELGAIDSALLADDLPIGAYSDKGFDAWLKHGSSE